MHFLLRNWDFGFRILDFGFKSPALRGLDLGFGFWGLDFGFWTWGVGDSNLEILTLYFRLWILDFSSGAWTLGFELWASN